MREAVLETHADSEDRNSKWPLFKNVQSPATFLIYFCLLTVNCKASKYVHFKILPMTRFELWTSGSEVNTLSTEPHQCHEIVGF